ncbi:MAG: DUF3391 domain-containing protein [Kangiellaceae bacterium]|nr:DUF3391 domain-containing protein [Kangiellaceae bacterium]
MKHLKNVKVWCEDLRPGMYVSGLDREWEATTFLIQGFRIESDYDVREISRQCKFVYVDFKSDEEFKLFKLHSTKSKTYANQLKADLGVSLTKRETKVALNRRQRTNSLLKSAFEQIMLGQDFDVKTIHEAVKENVQAVLKNENAMLILTSLAQSSEDSAEHCFATSILTICFCKFLGFSELELEDIGLASLLHDIGHVKVEPRLINKKGKLNSIEREKAEEHPKFGLDILSGKSNLTRSCIDVAYSHHERLDGSGYPRGLTGESITYNTRIVTIVDVYDTLTKIQRYRKSSPVAHAFKEMLNFKNSQFDGELLMKFIKWRGIYPLGAIVELNNGSVGIVITRPKTLSHLPKVLLVLNEYKQKTSEKIIDLSDSSLSLKIANAFEDSAFGIHLSEYLEKGLVIR